MYRERKRENEQDKVSDKYGKTLLTVKSGRRIFRSSLYYSCSYSEFEIISK